MAALLTPALIAAALLVLLSIAGMAYCLNRLGQTRAEFWERSRAQLLTQAAASAKFAGLLVLAQFLLLGYQSYRQQQQLLSYQADATQARGVAAQHHDQLAQLQSHLLKKDQQLADARRQLKRMANPQATQAQSTATPVSRAARISSSGAPVLVRNLPAGTVVGSAANGSAVNLESPDSVRAAGRQWVAITLSNGVSGWVAKSLVQLDAS